MNWIIVVFLITSYSVAPIPQFIPNHFYKSKEECQADANSMEKASDSGIVFKCIGIK